METSSLDLDLLSQPGRSGPEREAGVRLVEVRRRPLPVSASLQQHQRQPQREQHAHDDHGDEAQAPEWLALNVGDAE